MHDRFADGVEEALDARPVPPVPRELARAGTLRAPQLRIAGELAQRPRRRVDVTGRDERPVLAVAEEVVRRADPIGEDEREPARRGLVHHDRPRLALREEGEDVRRDVQLHDASPVDVSEERQPDPELARELHELLPLRAVAGEDEHQVRLVRSRDRAHEHVEPLLGPEARDAEDGDVGCMCAELAAQRLASTLEPLGPHREVLDVDGVREQVHALGRRAAREHRVAGERPRDEDPRSTLDDRRHDRALDRASPSRPRPLVVALDDEDVRDVLRPRTTRARPGRRTCSSRRRRRPAASPRRALRRFPG